MQNPFPLAELARIAPALWLFGGATVVLLADLFLHGWRAERDAPPPRHKWLLGALSLLAVAGSAWWALAALGERGATVFAGALRVDLFSNAIGGVILLGTALTLMSAADPLRRMRREHGEFYALVLYAAGAMQLLAHANSLILVFVSLETFSMAVYLLAAYDRDRRRGLEGALKYFLLGGLASAFLLLGMAFIYGATGELRLDRIQAALGASEGKALDSLFLAGVGLVLVGFGFKVGAFPFHAWIPDVYEGAPSLVTGFMAVTVKAAGFAILVRCAFAFLLDPRSGEPIGGAAHGVVEALWWATAGTIVLANLVACVQSSAKRMLAYSAISHTGYLLVGLVAALSPHAQADSGRGASILFYLLPYTFMTFGGFALLTALGRESPEGEDFDSFRGLSQRRPFLAFCALVFMISLSGIPPTAGFWGKLYLFRDAVQAGHWPLALLGILGSIVSVAYYLRLVVAMYLQKPLTAPGAAPAAADKAPMLGPSLAMAIAAIAVIAIGIFPEDFLRQSAATVRTVLGP